MSIVAKVDELLTEGQLSFVPSLFTGYETARMMTVSANVAAVIEPPFADTDAGRRHGELRAWLDNFSEGGEVSVAEDPFDKDPKAMLARVEPVESEIWSIRVTDPEDTAGVRSFGGFSEQDAFVAVTWEYREKIEDFDGAVSDAIAAWRDLFGSCVPFEGVDLNEYLTNWRPA
jgi:hypothetical protein